MVVGEGASLAHAGMMGVSDPPTDASLQAPMEDPPITASLGPIDRLIWRLKSLEECKHTPLPIGLCVNQIGKLREHLERFRKPLMNLSEMEETSFRAKWWMKEVRELCYDTEDYLVQSGATVHSRTLGRIARYIIWWIQSKLKLRTRLSKFMARAQVLKKTCETIIDLEIKAAISLNKEIKAEISLKEEKIADIETLTAQLVHMLAFEDDKQTELKLVAISGFQGSGKTTLARTLHVKCKRKFQCSAFVRVSRNPDFRSLLISILSQIKAPLPQGLSDVQGLISSISDHLQDKRYFIVIDDVRSPSVWDVISHAFPGGNFRSRMIVTTQSEQVEAAYSGYKLKSAIFKMGATADGCTHTSTKEKSKVLNIMYNNLPLHLKTCLLYFSMYPEGSTITKDDLAKRWVSEGFVAPLERHRIEEIPKVSQAKREEIVEGPQGERGEIVEVPQGKTEETVEVPQNKTKEIAHGYFDDLVARGMIQPVDRNHKGEVLSCTVHHMVLDLIRYKSKEDNFIVVVDNLESTLGHPDIVRRLSVQFGCEKGASIPESIILSQVRSLAFYGFLKCVPSIVDYGLLRVLNLHIWADEDKIFDLTRIGELCHLVHLKIECNTTVRLPTKIQRLQHLGTLELHAEVIAIPSDIGHLKKLMHLRCPSITDVRDLGDLTSLLDLQLTCSSVENLEEHMKCLHSVLEKLSSLRCLALVPANPSTMCISSESLYIMSSAPAHLHRLELSRRCCIFSRLPEWIGELHELRVLKIAVRELSREDIDILKGLPALTTLSLQLPIMAAEMIVFGQGGFSLLTYFKFKCNVPWLKFEADAMPNLEKLKLCFNSLMVDEQGTTPVIIIERLSGLRDISAIIGSAGVDAGSAWQKAIRNNPGNPKVQLMGLICYGDQGGGTVTREGTGEDQNIEAEIGVHTKPESSRLPVPAAHSKDDEPKDQPFISEIISIPNKSERTDEHSSSQVVMHGQQAGGGKPGRAYGGGEGNSGGGGVLSQGGGSAHGGESSLGTEGGVNEETVPHSVVVDPRLQALYLQLSNLVGIDGPMEELTNWLVDTHKKLKVLSIVGFGGLGKTALSKELYDKIKGQFHCEAFIYVSQKPDIKLLLNRLEARLCMTQSSQARALEDMVQDIREHLKGKRYLIVVDDLWDHSLWDIISCVFPNEANGSRVIVTTRVDSVAYAACHNNEDCIYRLSPLNDHNARMLFFGRVFGSSDGCPSYLEEVSADILKKCGGLPLAIITIASLLASQKVSRSGWEAIRNSLGALSTISPTLEDMKNILNLSYMGLPSHLRPCFLYFGMYPEDVEILVSVLIREWVAEGLVCNLHGPDLMDVGKSYINELINRSMIQPGRTENGEVVSCRVNDIMLDLILSKCAEDNFVSVASSSEDIRRLESCKYKVHRLSLRSMASGATNELSIGASLLSHVRSCAWARNLMPPLLLFKYLRVLTLDGDYHSLTIDLTAINQLFHLCYLRVLATDGGIKLPCAIKDLVCLETLDLTGFLNNSLPSDIIHLPCLSYLRLPVGASAIQGVANMKSLCTLLWFDLDKNSVKDISGLGELTNLRELQLCGHVEVSKIHALASSVGKLHKLKYLHIATNFVRDLSNQLGLLSSCPFNLMEKLMLEHWEFPRVPKWMGDLHCLRDLNLRALETSTEDVHVLGKLPSLVCLDFSVIKIRAERTVFCKGVFPVLEQFQFWSSNGDIMAFLVFEEGAMPKLRTLGLNVNVNAWGGSTSVGMEHLILLERICLYATRDANKILPSWTKDDLVCAFSNASQLHPNGPSVIVMYFAGSKF